MIAFLSCSFKATKYFDYSKVNCEDSLLIKHLKTLDSVVASNMRNKVFYCCTSSLNYIVNVSKIETSTGVTIVGRISFSKADWEKWRLWFTKNYAFAE